MAECFNNIYYQTLQIPNSDRCTAGNGTYACGQCYCNDGRFGRECECDVDTGGDESVDSCIP